MKEYKVCTCIEMIHGMVPGLSFRFDVAYTCARSSLENSFEFVDEVGRVRTCSGATYRFDDESYPAHLTR